VISHVWKATTTRIVSEQLVTDQMYFWAMYRLHWYCWVFFRQEVYNHNTVGKNGDFRFSSSIGLRENVLQTLSNKFYGRGYC